MIEQIADKAIDPQMTDFIEGEYLQEQVQIIILYNIISYFKQKQNTI